MTETSSMSPSKMDEDQNFAPSKMNEDDILPLLTTGLDDIPSVIRQLTEAVDLGGGESDDALLWALWYTVYEAAGLASSDEQLNRLVDFLVQLTKVEVKDPATGEAIRSYGERKVWTDLPIFGMQTREWYNFDLNDVKGEELIKIERQVRMLSLFMATDQNGGNAMYALWGLREAFEGEQDTISSSAVRLTAPWILNTGKVVWQLVEREVELPARCGIPGLKYRDDKQWKGYNKERWAVWRNGFLRAQAEVEEEEVKKLAGRAAERMKELEG